ncbi:MAG: glycosyltransferase [Vicinamibacterales bacterium]
MRIALVVTGGFDENARDRVIPSLLWLVERLARQHDIVVYVLRYQQTPRRYPLLGATIQDLGRPRGIARQFRALRAAIISDGSFDVIHAYWAVPAGLVAACVGRSLGVPVVVTCDSGEFVTCPDIGYGQQSHWRGRVAVALATRLAARVTVCSEYQRALARAHGVVTDVVPLGVDTRIFSPRPALPDGPPFRLLHVASLNPVKDQATLIHAMHELRARHLDLHLDIVGEDTTSGASARLVQALSLGERVTFHGFRSSADLVPLYQLADLFVLSSRHEAAGVVLLEAAACGTPVVGSAVGYLADWEPAAATSVAPARPNALADAVEGLLFDRPRREAQAALAARWVREHDADWTARTFEALYHDVLAPRRHELRADSGERHRTPGS